MSDITVKIVKETSPVIGGTYKGLKVQASKDNVPLQLIMEALFNYKDQEFLAEALIQKNVQAFAKIGTKFHSLGFISADTYERYKIFKKNKK